MREAGASFVTLVRFVLALTFVLSAAFKVRHPNTFRAVLVSLFGRRLPSAADTVAPALVATLELVVAVLLVVPTDGLNVGAFAGIALIVVFTGVLLRSRDLTYGCGCWRAPSTEPGLGTYLTRNLVLLLLAVVSAFPVHAPSSAMTAGLALLAGIPAFLIMEIPGLATSMRQVLARP